MKYQVINETTFKSGNKYTQVVDEFTSEKTAKRIAKGLQKTFGHIHNSTYTVKPIKL